MKLFRLGINMSYIYILFIRGCCGWGDKDHGTLYRFVGRIAFTIFLPRAAITFSRVFSNEFLSRSHPLCVHLARCLRASLSFAFFFSFVHRLFIFFYFHNLIISSLRRATSFIRNVIFCQILFRSAGVTGHIKRLSAHKSAAGIHRVAVGKVPLCFLAPYIFLLQKNVTKVAAKFFKKLNL